MKAADFPCDSVRSQILAPLYKSDVQRAPYNTLPAAAMMHLPTGSIFYRRRDYVVSVSSEPIKQLISWPRAHAACGLNLGLSKKFYQGQWTVFATDYWLD